MNMGMNLIQMPNQSMGMNPMNSMMKEKDSDKEINLNNQDEITIKFNNKMNHIFLKMKSSSLVTELLNEYCLKMKSFSF